MSLARKVDPHVKCVAERCELCHSIDSTPNRHANADDHVEKNWCWLDVDITHY